MNSPFPAPKPQVTRSNMLNIRLTPQERQIADALAQRFQVKTSQLARHFLMQAITYYMRQTQQVSTQTATQPDNTRSMSSNANG